MYIFYSTVKCIENLKNELYQHHAKGDSCLNPKVWCFSALLILHEAPRARSRYIYIRRIEYSSLN